MTNMVSLFIVVTFCSVTRARTRTYTIARGRHCVTYSIPPDPFASSSSFSGSAAACSLEKRDSGLSQYRPSPRHPSRCPARFCRDIWTTLPSSRWTAKTMRWKQAVSGQQGEAAASSSASAAAGRSVSAHPHSLRLFLPPCRSMLAWGMRLETGTSGQSCGLLLIARAGLVIIAAAAAASANAFPSSHQHLW